jgi:hypothetical protein
VAQDAIRFYPSALDSLVVTLTKRNVSLDAVPEACQLLNEWDDSQVNAKVEDKLRWRQRTGFDFSVILTDREAKVRILQALLSALWSDLVVVDAGSPGSPDAIRIKDPAAVHGGVDLPSNRMRLGLSQPPKGLSSWSEVIPAYERLVLAATDADRAHCEVFMAHVPKGIRTGALEPPGPLYEDFLAATESDLRIARKILANEREPQGARDKAAAVDKLWSELLRDAELLEFEGEAAYGNHDQIQYEFGIPRRGSGSLPDDGPGA